MWHMLNTMFKNVDREFRYVDAILKSLEANGEQGEKHGLGAVTAACLEVKSRKVQVHKAYAVDAAISDKEVSADAKEASSADVRSVAASISPCMARVVSP